MSKEIPFNKSFASNEKSKYWSDKNELKPYQVSKNSHKKYLFNCNICNHDFHKSLDNKSWCPFCSSKKLCNINECNLCFEKSFASNEKSKYWSDKNELKPRQVFKKSDNKYIINCNICNHDFYISTSNINCGFWCPYCSNKKLCDNNECNLCFEKSFSSHEKSKYWSDNKLKPRQVFKNSNKKYLFNCNICNHDFLISVDSINKDCFCSYCCNQKLCEDENCNLCFEKSFASHEKSKYWSDENKLKPRQVFKQSNIKYIFTCNICNHYRYQSLNNIQKNNCVFCAGQKICEDENCNLCFEKSFASHEKSKYWSDENKLKPRQVFKQSNIKYIFTCNICNHNFDATLNHISSKIKSTWCPFCINKTEQKLYEKLVLIYPELIQQYKVEWCKNITYLPFDFCIEEYKIIIELDGRQHFEQVSNWNCPKENQERDKFKMKCANENNYSVIRILQEDVFYDTFDWIHEIKQAIQKIIDDKIIQNIFICKNNEYNIFN